MKTLLVLRVRKRLVQSWHCGEPHRTFRKSFAALFEIGSLSRLFSRKRNMANEGSIRRAIVQRRGAEHIGYSWKNSLSQLYNQVAQILQRGSLTIGIITWIQPSLNEKSWAQKGEEAFFSLFQAFNSQELSHNLQRNQTSSDLDTLAIAEEIGRSRFKTGSSVYGNKKAYSKMCLSSFRRSTVFSCGSGVVSSIPLCFYGMFSPILYCVPFLCGAVESDQHILPECLQTAHL